MHKYFGPSRYFLPQKPEFTVALWLIGGSDLEIQRLTYFFEMTWRWPKVVLQPWSGEGSWDQGQSLAALGFATIFCVHESTVNITPESDQVTGVGFVKNNSPFLGVPQCPDSGHWGISKNGVMGYLLTNPSRLQGPKCGKVMEREQRREGDFASLVTNISTRRDSYFLPWVAWQRARGWGELNACILIFPISIRIGGASI